VSLSYRTVVSYDGTKIAYQTTGDGPAVVLVNGLGGDVEAWRFLIETLGPRRKIVCWDYRGLFRSQAPSSWQTLGPREQALDLLPILDAEGIDRFALVGWSMGVQVALEVYRAAASRVQAIAAVNGVAGRPFDTALAWRFSRHVLPLVIAQVRRSAPLFGRISRGVVGWRGLLPTMQRLGLVGATLDGEVFMAVAKQFATIDFDLYGATLEALGRHDAWDVLPSVKVPVVLIAGDRDVMTPMKVARKMARTLPDAQLVVLEGGTHYTPVEYPARVGEEVLRLLARAGC